MDKTNLVFRGCSWEAHTTRRADSTNHCDEYEEIINLNQESGCLNGMIKTMSKKMTGETDDGTGNSDGVGNSDKEEDQKGRLKISL